MKKIMLGENIELEFKRLVNGRTFISGMTGSGKSWTMRKMCEELFGSVGIIILDPEGEFSSLREKYPFLIIGKDIPLEIESAEYIAEQVLKENISVIIDFSTTDVIDQQRFTSKFIDKFMTLETKLKKSYVIFIEESDEFCPEKGTFKSESLRSIINIAKKGRKRGIGLVFATQRPAFVSKFVISQCQNKIIGRTEWTGDLKVIKNFLQIEDDTIRKISGLQQGNFYFSGNFIKEKGFYKVGKVKTTHSGESPKIIPPTTNELKSIIQKLSKSLPKIKEKISPIIPDVKKIENRLKSNIEKPYKEKIFKLEREIKGLKAQQVSEEEVQERINKATDELLEKTQEQEVEIVRLRKFVASIIAKGSQFLGDKKEELVREETPNIELNYDLWLNKFGGKTKTVLELLIKHKKLTKDQLVIMAGTKKSNITHNILPKLKRAGLVTYDEKNVRIIGG